MGNKAEGVKMRQAASRRAGALARHLVIKDESTGKEHKIKVSEGNTFKASDLKPLGIRTYDPGYTNTAAVKSSISYIDGGKVSSANKTPPFLPSFLSLSLNKSSKKRIEKNRRLGVKLTLRSLSLLPHHRHPLPLLRAS